MLLWGSVYVCAVGDVCSQITLSGSVQHRPATSKVAAYVGSGLLPSSWKAHHLFSHFQGSPVLLPAHLLSVTYTSFLALLACCISGGYVRPKVCFQAQPEVKLLCELCYFRSTAFY